jgi:hypothetical protein
MADNQEGRICLVSARLNGADGNLTIEQIEQHQ